MPELADKIEAARYELARLEREAAHATCADLGCNMESTGGCNCGCVVDHDDEGNEVIGQCSVPVNICTRCGDCDYGDSAEAAEIRWRCADRNNR